MARDLIDPPTMELAAILTTGELHNGLKVFIRPLMPSDRDMVASSFAVQTARSRFLHGRTDTPDAGWDPFAADVDQVHHTALAMFWPNRSRADVLLGIGRYSVCADDPGVAEVSVTVAEELRGRGGDTLLLHALATRAYAAGIRAFTAHTVPHDDRLRRLLTTVGPLTDDVRTPSHHSLRVELDPPPAHA